MFPPARHRRRLCAAVVLGVVGIAARAHAHVPALVELSARVDAQAVRIQLRVVDDVFRTWFGIDVADAVRAERGTGSTTRTLEEKLASWIQLAIDRVPVMGVIESVESKTWSDHGLTRTYGVLTVAYGAKGEPREVSLAWTRFEGAGEWVFDELETEVEGFGETSYYRLVPREPELVWHRPLAKVVKDVPIPRIEEKRRELVVSLPALVLGLLLVVGAVAAVRVRAFRRPVVGLGLAAAAIGLGVAHVVPVALPLPGRSGLERPDPEEAKALFESLLRNVYRAFDYDREDAIYDTLALTVSGPLLDRIYEEVYTSLVMKEQGGAVSKVEKVDILEQQPSFPAEPTDPTFEVRARWRVHGKVGHWGHTHQRVNEHEAVYTVAPEGDRWKIVGMKVLSQTRVDTEANR